MAGEVLDNRTEYMGDYMSRSPSCLHCTAWLTNTWTENLDSVLYYPAYFIFTAALLVGPSPGLPVAYPYLFPSQ